MPSQTPAKLELIIVDFVASMQNWFFSVLDPGVKLKQGHFQSNPATEKLYIRLHLKLTKLKL